jgi:hypothetical protein
MNSLKNTFLMLKGKVTLFGNVQKIEEIPKQHHPNTQIFNTSGTTGKKRQGKS